MNALSLLPLFLVGLAGSVHCIGMCGGIVGALSLGGGTAAPSRPVIAIAVARPALPSNLQSNVLRVLAYNGGRIANLRIATSESWKDRATGERKERYQATEDFLRSVHSCCPPRPSPSLIITAHWAGRHSQLHGRRAPRPDLRLLRLSPRNLRLAIPGARCARAG